MDPVTIRHLETLGVGEGWQCLEVGGGGGSITEWLCERVGQSGRVVATDVDTRFLETLDHPNLEVRRHNIVTDELESGRFDLVHVRAVLVNVPEPAKALGRMVAALKPGGWLLAEEGDWRTFAPGPDVPTKSAALFRKHWRVIEQLWLGRGMDPDYGRRLFQQMRALGLEEVHSEGYTEIVPGGSPCAQMQRLTWEQLRQETLASGELSEPELEDLLELLTSPDFSWDRWIVWTAKGRRPSR